MSRRPAPFDSSFGVPASLLRKKLFEVAPPPLLSSSGRAAAAFVPSIEAFFSPPVPFSGLFVLFVKGFLCV